MFLDTTKYNLQSNPDKSVEVLDVQTQDVGTYGPVSIDGIAAGYDILVDLGKCKVELGKGKYKSAPEMPVYSGVTAEQYINEDNNKQFLMLKDRIILETCYEQLSDLMSKEEPKNLEEWDEQAKEIAKGIEVVMEGLGAPIDQDLKRSK